MHEILRLEPVVGELRRTAREPITVHTESGPVTIAPGERIELQLRRTNADPGVVGENPDALCPGRELPPAVPPALLSFGDGHHRCPGGPLAILESDIFLHRLLAHDVVAAARPGCGGTRSRRAMTWIGSWSGSAIEPHGWQPGQGSVTRTAGRLHFATSQQLITIYNSWLSLGEDSDRASWDGELSGFGVVGCGLDDWVASVGLHGVQLVALTGCGSKRLSRRFVGGVEHDHEAIECSVNVRRGAGP